MIRHQLRTPTTPQVVADLISAEVALCLPQPQPAILPEHIQTIARAVCAHPAGRADADGGARGRFVTTPRLTVCWWRRVGRLRVAVDARMGFPIDTAGPRGPHCIVEPGKSFDILYAAWPERFERLLGALNRRLRPRLSGFILPRAPIVQIVACAPGGAIIRTRDAWNIPRLFLCGPNFPPREAHHQTPITPDRLACAFRLPAAAVERLLAGRAAPWELAAELAAASLTSLWAAP